MVVIHAAARKVALLLSEFPKDSLPWDSLAMAAPAIDPRLTDGDKPLLFP
jgi:hypothetical protein